MALIAGVIFSSFGFYYPYQKENNGTSYQKVNDNFFPPHQFPQLQGGLNIIFALGSRLRRFSCFSLLIRIFLRSR